jgi:ribosomal protein S18 acetylase RimI-like enzyme
VRVIRAPIEKPTTGRPRATSEVSRALGVTFFQLSRFSSRPSLDDAPDLASALLEACMNLRDITFDDLPDVLRLYAQPDFDNGEVLDDTQARALYARFLTYPDYKIYVAEEGGRIVGSFALLVMLNLGHCGAPSAIVEDVVVDPQMQGRGVGAAMMRAAMDLARNKGCYKLVLSSNAKRVRAHAFYEQLGFMRHGISFSVIL